MALTPYAFIASSNPFTDIRASHLGSAGFFAGTDSSYGFDFVVADAAFYSLETFVRTNAVGKTFTGDAMVVSSASSLRAIINAQYVLDNDRVMCIPTSWTNPPDWEAFGERIEAGIASMPLAEPTGCGISDSSTTRYFGRWDGRTTTAYSVGKGFPSSKSPTLEYALGGLLPIIEAGIPFGNGDVIDSATGIVSQRNSNALVGTFWSEGPDKGKVLYGTHEGSQTIFFIAQEDGASPGIDMPSLIAALQAFGVKNAVTGDGSDSAALIVDGAVEVVPNPSQKDKFLVTGFALRLNSLTLTSTAADAYTEFHACTIPTLKTKFGSTFPATPSKQTGATAQLSWTSAGQTLNITSFGGGLTKTDLDISSLPITLSAVSVANDLVAGVNFSDSSRYVSIANLKLVVSGVNDPGTLTGTLTIIGSSGTTVAQASISWKLT